MKKALLFLIELYRKGVSPTFPPCCRFVPTCSTYAVEAIERFGALKGSILAFFRVLRCNGLFRGGYDPVPRKRAR